MADPRSCPECGATLGPDAPDGACPVCALRRALVPPAGSPEAVVTEKPGDRIGHYKLLEPIGEGGYGLVYLAEQAEPIRRRVALKIVKLGMDTKQVIARFEAERQALALMDHPNIARVLDAGATETGRPYFVMELVRGVRITEYCDRHQLSTRARLGLFMQVCHAVQHAHQKGIIHRDLKPSNILVTEQAGQAVPKVIDFGIAKATAQPLTDKTLYTAFQQFLGTPAYMSPEQTERRGADIDTRSDIYSLGVLLYELLTSRLPFEQKELLQAGVDGMQRLIREKDPSKPSTRLSTLALADLTLVAKQRGAEPPKLISLVRGDLDWIVMKCLEKDRARRYETANGLALDVQRHLQSEPVLARSPSRLYRFQKFVRRNRVAFSLLATLAAVLVLGIVVSTWLAVRAIRAEREQFRLRQLLESADKRSATEESKVTQVAKFVTEMLEGVGPSVAQGRDTQLLRGILDKAAERVRKDLKGQPEVEAELLNTIGEVHLQLGAYAQAEALRRETLALRRSVFGNEHRKVADSLNNLANALFRQGKLAEAEATHREALAMRRKLLGEEHADVAASLNNLATALWEQNKLAEAETLLRESLAMRRKLFGNDHADVAESLDNLGAVLSLEEKITEAEATQREALALTRRLLGNDHPDLAFSLNNLADTLRFQGKLAEAESVNREALALRKKVLGAEHPDVAFSLYNLATTLGEEGRLVEAEELHREALAMRRKLLKPDHLEIAGSLNNLAGILIRQGKFTEAETLQRQALAIQQKSLAADHPDIAGSLENLGAALGGQDQFAEAEAALRDCLAIRQKCLDKGHPFVARTMDALAQVLVTGRKPEEAAKLYREAAELGNASAQFHLAGMYASGRGVAKDPAEAAKWYRKAAEQYRKAAEGGGPEALSSLARLLATCSLSELRDGRSAVAYAEKAAAATNRKEPAILDTLAAAYAEAGQFEQAVSVQREALGLLTTEAARKEFTTRLKLYEAKTPYRDVE